MTGISNYGMGPLRARGNTGTGKTQGTGSVSGAGSASGTPTTYDASTDTFNGGSIEILVTRDASGTTTTICKNPSEDHSEAVGEGYTDNNGNQGGWSVTKDGYNEW